MPNNVKTFQAFRSYDSLDDRNNPFKTEYRELVPDREVESFSNVRRDSSREERAEEESPESGRVYSALYYNPDGRKIVIRTYLSFGVAFILVAALLYSFFNSKK